MNNSIEYKGYHATIDVSVEDSLFIGEVIGINDSLHFHGTSYEELTEAFHTSIDDYLDMCEKLGRLPDKEYKGSFNIRINPLTHKKLDLAAKRQGKSLNQYISDVLDDEVNGKHQSSILYVSMNSQWNAPARINSTKSLNGSNIYESEVSVN